VDATALDGEWSHEQDASLAEILAVLAHEFRNPLASMQGCAQTLVDKGEELPQAVRTGLSEVIVKHAARMDWLVRAAAAFGGVGERIVDEVDLGRVLTEAAAISGVSFDVVGATRRFGDGRRLRLAVEAVLLAANGTEVQVEMPSADVLQVRTSDADVGRNGRRWKLDLAARLLREEGCVLTVQRTGHGAVLRIHFGGGQPDPGGTR
jgi:hypothetical protein